MLLIAPVTVFEAFVIMPPKRCSMPCVIAAMPSSADTCPLWIISIICCVVTPKCFASISRAGIEFLDKLRIASIVTLPRERITPKSWITACKFALLPPTAATASPTAVSIGMTSCDVKPNAIKCCPHCCTVSKLNGEMIARRLIWSIKFRACVALPVSCVSAIVTVSAFAALSSPHCANLPPNAVTPKPTAPKRAPTCDKRSPKDAMLLPALATFALTVKLPLIELITS